MANRKYWKTCFYLNEDYDKVPTIPMAISHHFKTLTKIRRHETQIKAVAISNKKTNTNIYK